MTVKLFARWAHDGPASTQFAATIVAPPTEDAAPAAGTDAFAPDSLATDEPAGPGAMPDLVTDIGDLCNETEAPAGLDAVDPLQAPTLSRIGRYALKRELGAGGLGTVFEAWDPLLSRTVAVKTLHLGTQDGATPGHSLDGLFLNEARAAAGLNHRYIVTIHDAGLSPQGVYIAMERLHGRDLQHALAEGWQPTPEQAALLVRRIADALAYAHARGVVHCDIKPANIFLQRKDRPKVLDFGIARLLHGSGLPLPAGTVLGSPRYRAPEQLTGAAVDARTDLFSLGVVMYELLTGQRAFAGRSLGEIDRAVLQQDPPPAHECNPEVPAELSAITARLMARDPTRRPASAGELALELRGWLAAQQSTAQTVTMTAVPRVPAPVAAPRARASSRALFIGAFVLGLVALGLGVFGPKRAATPVAAAPPPALATHTADASPAAALAVPALPAPITTSASPPPSGLAAAGPAAADGTAPPRSAGAPPAALARRSVDAKERARPPAQASTANVTTAAPLAAAAAPATGTLTLAVSPWGKIEVDGKPAGTTPPLSRLTLPAGLHTVTLRNADFPPHTVQLQVETGKPATLRHRFGS